MKVVYGIMNGKRIYLKRKVRDGFSFTTSKSEARRVSSPVSERLIKDLRKDLGEMNTEDVD